ncbi:MAG: SagB/ThcOx family dehydrogenase [Clostridia bacterium]|nr:SagB/ThcOx family dehydrogenase [Clostridia bacterium]
MDEREVKEVIVKGRNFMKGMSDDLYPDFESDQQKMLKQPPLVKAPVSDIQIDLPTDFENLEISHSFEEIINMRSSHRVFTEENLTLLQLSYLLWATQGIKSIRGKSYATLRTVPCGGARHQYETYMFIQHVEGLKKGLYHYLPMGHKLEFLGEENDMEKISDSVCEQKWALKASVIFYWSIVSYRVEWRYGVFAHRTALIDVGHIGQNLYLAATALDLGCCGVASFDHKTCCDMFSLDGDEEFVVYTAPLGTVSPDNIEKEQDFYSFVKEQGL